MPALGDGVYNILLALVFEKDGCEKLPILMESCRGPASECSLQVKVCQSVPRIIMSRSCGGEAVARVC